MTIVLNELQHSQIEKDSKTKLQAFQRKLYLKAKQNPRYKFYCLYDKVFRPDTLNEAYKRVKTNGGIGGVDKIEFKDLKDKESEFVNEIQNELKRKTYKPNKLKEIEIPKKSGKVRLLRIPTIKDRVVQMAVKIIIEPIFEADFKENSYGYRPGKSAHQAIGKLNKYLFKDIYRPEKEKKDIKSIDLADCFNNIPHKELIDIIARRIIDRQMLKLIKSMIKAKTENETGKKDKGTPQGGVLSPLIANIYLNKIDEYWKDKKLESQMIRYADDMVIVLSRKEEQEFNKFIKFIEINLKLPINHKKTKTDNTKDGVEFLGFQLKEKISKKKKLYLSKEPSKEAMNRIREKIREVTKYRKPKSNQEIIKETNIILKGWQQYYDNVGMGKTREQINQFTKLRVAKMISRRNKRTRITWKLFEKKDIYNGYGLYKMKSLKRVLA